MSKSLAFLSLAAGLIALGLTTTAPTSAEANAVCAKRSTMLKNLDAKYQEKQRALGIQTNGSVVEVYTSATGTFSIVVTLPDGQSCIIIAGDDWQEYQSKEVAADQRGA